MVNSSVHGDASDGVFETTHYAVCDQTRGAGLDAAGPRDITAKIQHAAGQRDR